VRLGGNLQHAALVLRSGARTAHAILALHVAARKPRHADGTSCQARKPPRLPASARLEARRDKLVERAAACVQDERAAGVVEDGAGNAAARALPEVFGHQRAFVQRILFVVSKLPVILRGRRVVLRAGAACPLAPPALGAAAGPRRCCGTALASRGGGGGGGDRRRWNRVACDRAPHPREWARGREIERESFGVLQRKGAAAGEQAPRNAKVERVKGRVIRKRKIRAWERPHRPQHPFPPLWAREARSTLRFWWAPTNQFPHFKRLAVLRAGWTATRW
jgi:hypothetical protein